MFGCLFFFLQSNGNTTEISRDDWTAAIETMSKSLSDKEVQFYEELNTKKDTFNFG